MSQQKPLGPLPFLHNLPGKAGYHHGNLKMTLLDGAEEVIATRGPTGLTLSELARMAGVSPAAIYRHFPDLPALVGAVALRGFQDFAAQLRSARHAAGGGNAGFAAMGTAYLTFARERPGAYAAMFSSSAIHTDAELANAGKSAFETMSVGLSDALTEYGVEPGAAFSLAIKIWALAHGIATLTGAGRLSPAIGNTPEHMLLDGVSALIRAAAIGKP